MTSIKTTDTLTPDPGHDGRATSEFRDADNDYSPAITLVEPVPEPSTIGGTMEKVSGTIQEALGNAFSTPDLVNKGRFLKAEGEARIEAAKLLERGQYDPSGHEADSDLHRPGGTINITTSIPPNPTSENTSYIPAATADSGPTLLLKVPPEPKNVNTTSTVCRNDVTMPSTDPATLITVHYDKLDTPSGPQPVRVVNVHTSPNAHFPPNVPFEPDNSDPSHYTLDVPLKSQVSAFVEGAALAGAGGTGSGLTSMEPPVVPPEASVEAEREAARAYGDWAVTKTDEGNATVAERKVPAAVDMDLQGAKIPEE
ncbi:hypothetical protein M427DRAFT_56545, partial [Gonapodya prolifera JEL478]